MVLLMLPGVMLLLVSLMILMQVRRAGGSLAWTPKVSHDTKRLWLAVFVVACIVILVIFGPAAMLIGWQFFVVAPAIAFGCFKLADWLFRKPDAPREIVHQNGRRARVTRNSYTPLPSPDGTPTTGGKSDRAAWSSVKKALWD